MQYPFRLPFSSPFRGAFSLAGFGATIPAVSELLIWLRGSDDTEQKLDSWKQPDAENFTMSQSHCISLNGTDEYGTLDTAITLSGDFEITVKMSDSSGDTNSRPILGSENITTGIIRVQTGTHIGIYLNSIFMNFTSVLVPDGSDVELLLSRSNDQLTATIGNNSQTLTSPTTDLIVNKIAGLVSFQGQLYNLRLKDSTQDIHFRMAEGSGMYSFDDTGDRYITWSGAEVDLWGQRQDSYHGNCTDGFGYRENLIEFSEDFSNAVWNLSSYLVNHSVTKTIAPNGKLTADNIAADAELSGSTISRQDYPTSTEGAYTYSVWLRADIPKQYRLQIRKDTTIIISTDISVTTEWQKFSVDGVASGVFSAIKTYIYTAEDMGIDFDVWGGQLTANGGATYIKTQDYTFDGTEKLPFLNDERGGTFNGAETSFAPEEKPVGTFVAGDSIATPTNHGSLSSYAGTAGLVYNGATIQRITDGWARNLVFSDGTIIPLDEGEGTDIHDSDGNLVGTLSGTLPDFWIAGEPMVAQSVMDMERGKFTGLSDGTQEILLPFTAPPDCAATHEGTAILTVDIPNSKITMTSGTLKHITVTGTMP